MDLLLLGILSLVVEFIHPGLLQWGKECRLGLHPAPSHFRSPAHVAGEEAVLVLLSSLRTNLAGYRKQVLADDTVIWEDLEGQAQLVWWGVCCQSWISSVSGGPRFHLSLAAETKSRKKNPNNCFLQPSHPAFSPCRNEGSGWFVMAHWPNAMAQKEIKMFWFLG